MTFKKTKMKLSNFWPVFINKLILKKIRYIIWDFDGTLWQSNQLGYKLKLQFIKYLSNHLSKPITEAEFDKLIKSNYNWSQNLAQITKIPELNIVDKIDSTFNKTKFLKKNSKIIKFVYQFSNQKHIILSNSSHGQLIAGLKKIGFPQRQNQILPFEKIISRDTFNLLKPSQKLFKYINQYTGAKKQQHLVIGDSYNNDINPAKKYGFNAIHINNFKKKFSL